ncbi:hypothetical protein [Actinoplanes sp. NPDC089786]|uniref:hypothetical protein n=1 Tax=Actinoplanes sp. NPDC089786 TaxID=3155185 RepID=UPI0034149285
MGDGLGDGLALRLCRARDLAALIGLLAVLEGELMVGGVSSHLLGRLRERLAHEGLIAPAATEDQLCQAIHDLNQGLRYALGEFDEPPSSAGR